MVFDGEQREYSGVLTGVKSSIQPQVETYKSDNKSTDITYMEVDRSSVSNEIIPPMAMSTHSVCFYTAATSNILEQSSKVASEA